MASWHEQLAKEQAVERLKRDMLAALDQVERPPRCNRTVRTIGGIRVKCLLEHGHEGRCA